MAVRYAVVAIAALCSAAHGLESTLASRCQENLMIPVSATATNKELPDSFNISSLTLKDRKYFEDLALKSPDRRVSGDYQISARYCTPAVDVPKRRDTLQILVHGIVGLAMLNKAIHL